MCIDIIIHVLPMFLVFQESGWAVVSGVQVARALSKQVPSSAISAANSEVAVLQPSACAKVRRAYLKTSAKKAKLGKRAAKRGVLATIHYLSFL